MESSHNSRRLVTEIVFATCTVCFVHQSSHARKMRLAFWMVFHLSARALGLFLFAVIRCSWPVSQLFKGILAEKVSRSASEADAIIRRILNSM